MSEKMTVERAVELAGEKDADGILRDIFWEFQDSPLVSGTEQSLLSIAKHFGWPAERTLAALALVMCVRARSLEKALVDVVMTTPTRPLMLPL
jgi:hypothetical protein